MRTARFAMVAGGLCGFLGVAAGAFGAHALSDRLDSELLKIYQTAVLYHLLHAVALVAVGAAACALATRDTRATHRLTVSSWAFVLGIVLFSGSLYALALSGWSALGAVTPVGGAAFLLGWIFLLFTAARVAVEETSAKPTEKVE